MSLASNAGTLVSHYRGAVAGYDATGTRLLDLSGNGAHLPLLAGTPAFGTYSTKPGLQLRGDTYFGPPIIDTVPVYPFPTRYTQIAVLWANLNGIDNYSFVSGMQRDYANADPAWKTPTTNFESSAAAAFAIRLFISGNGFALRGGSANYQAITTYNSSAWNVVQFAVDPDASQYRMRVNAGAWIVGAIPAGRQLVPMDDFRLGYKPTVIDTTSGRDFALSQLITLNGDPANENSDAYNALISALVADPTA